MNVFNRLIMLVIALLLIAVPVLLLLVNFGILTTNQVDYYTGYQRAMDALGATTVSGSGAQPSQTQAAGGQSGAAQGGAQGGGAQGGGTQGGAAQGGAQGGAAQGGAAQGGGAAQQGGAQGGAAQGGAAAGVVPSIGTRIAALVVGIIVALVALTLLLRELTFGRRVARSATVDETPYRETFITAQAMRHLAEGAAREAGAATPICYLASEKRRYNVACNILVPGTQNFAELASRTRSSIRRVLEEQQVPVEDVEVTVQGTAPQG